jgi:hypothetical protein
MITITQLRAWKACYPERRAADLARHLGREVADQDGLALEGWAEVLSADGKPSATTPDLSWAMIRLDLRRWMQAMALVLEAILPPCADPRSLAIVPALRSGVVTRAARTWAAAWAAWAAAAAWDAADAADAAAWAAQAAQAAELAAPHLGIRSILLRGWAAGGAR